MFVGLCQPAKASVLCGSVHRPFACHLRALSLVSASKCSSVPAITTSALPTTPSHPVKSFSHQVSGTQSMPWASALGHSSHISVAGSQLNSLRRNLNSSQRFARQAAPYVGCLTIASAAALHRHRQQPDRQKRGQPGSSKATVAEASAFSSMRHSDDSSAPSSSESDSPDSAPGSRSSENGNTAA